LFQFFSTKTRDWLERQEIGWKERFRIPKWPILCQVGRKTTTQSISILSVYGW